MFLITQHGHVVRSFPAYAEYRAAAGVARSLSSEPGEFGVVRARRRRPIAVR